MADWWGRRTPIAVGGIIMILGGLLGTFANGYGSKFNLSGLLFQRLILITLQCMSLVDSFLALATPWLKCLPLSCLLSFAILNIVAVSLPSITACGTWVHFVSCLTCNGCGLRLTSSSRCLDRLGHLDHPQ